MKKLATYIMAGFLSVGIASPAFSDIDCDYVKISTEAFLKNFKQLTEMAGDDKYDSASQKQFVEWRNNTIAPANMMANVYNALCK